jgi:hypothetical protein
MQRNIFKLIFFWLIASRAFASSTFTPTSLDFHSGPPPYNVKVTVLFPSHEGFEEYVESMTDKPVTLTFAGGLSIIPLKGFPEKETPYSRFISVHDHNQLMSILSTLLFEVRCSTPSISANITFVPPYSKLNDYFSTYTGGIKVPKHVVIVPEAPNIGGFYISFGSL